MFPVRECGDGRRMQPNDDAAKAADEAVFREANEQIRAAERRFEAPMDSVPYICECDDVSCHELIPLSEEAYEAVRSDPTQFVIRPGHSTRGTVVEDNGAYLVVTKTGAGAEVARMLDPRKDRR